MTACDDAVMLVLPGGDGWAGGSLAAFGALARRFREAYSPRTLRAWYEFNRVDTAKAFGELVARVRN
ncbi:hypothetical protein [Lentzea sp. NPDC059081]|uniref:hypothetical protein n=1 Tax=Lentzea sp. NPDC059081 TaxID=3346719 RepID=UPI0036752BBB